MLYYYQIIIINWVIIIVSPLESFAMMTYIIIGFLKWRRIWIIILVFIISMQSHVRLVISWRKSGVLFSIIKFEVSTSFTSGDSTGFSFSISFSITWVLVVKIFAIFIWVNTEITIYFVFERSTIILIIITLIEEIIIPIDFQISIIFIVWYSIFSIITNTRSRFRVDFCVCIPWNRSEFKFILIFYRTYSWFRFIFVFFFLSFSSLDVIVCIYITSLSQFIYFLI